MNIYLSILESIYLCYMFNFYKTNTYYTHPFDFITTNKPLFRHDTSLKFNSKICFMGNIVGILSPLWFIGRHYNNNIDKINNMLILLLLIGTLLTNMNAFVYCIPIFIIGTINLK